MYTLLVTESNELIVSQPERIMCRSKLVDKLHFLVDQSYKDLPMSEFTVMLEYLLPVSKRYCSEILTLSSELYKEKLEYTLPFDTDLTSEPGNIEVQLTFFRVIMDDDGKTKQQVRKTSPCKITIIPITAWSDIIPDSALTALDQRMIKMDAQINALNELGESLDNTKADNLYLDPDDNTLTLESNGKQIGRKIYVAVPPIKNGEYDGLENGILELDHISVTGGNPNDNSESGCDCPDFVEL